MQHSNAMQEYKVHIATHLYHYLTTSFPALHSQLCIVEYTLQITRQYWSHIVQSTLSFPIELNQCLLCIPSYGWCMLVCACVGVCCNADRKMKYKLV